MNDLPKITIVTICLNAAATLARAMQSLREQNYPNLQYIVLDAASTDGTLDIIKANADIISFWRSEKDGGPHAACNEGIGHATGQLVSFLNADDWYEPGILRAIGEVFAQDPSVDMITCEAKVWRVGPAGGEVLVKHYKGKNLQLNPYGTPLPNARFFARSIFERFGYFNTLNHKGQKFIAGDLEFLLRLSQYKLKNRVLPQLGYNYLMHPGSLTMGENPALLRQMYEERTYISESYLQAGTLPAYKKRLKRWHRRGTARAFFWQLAADDYAGALHEMARGLRYSPLAWLPECLKLAVTRRYKSL